jgi:hypothetical protein
MKKLLPFAIFIVLTLVFCTNASAQTIDWDAVKQAYINKYQPEKMPAWLFPIIAKEGGGQMDTIYLGYDPDAQVGLGDSIFGERRLPIDRNTFNAVWVGNVNDSAFKSMILNKVDYGLAIDFYNGILPVTIYWDRTAFYSDSLPYPDLSPAPRAKGFLHCSDLDPWNYDNCPDQLPVTFTDTPFVPNSGWYVERYSKPDSFVYDGNLDFTNSVFGGFILEIVPWKTFLPGAGTGRKKTEHLIKIAPNPAQNEVRILRQGNQFCQITFYDLTGRVWLDTELLSDKEELLIKFLPEGFYIVKITIPGFNYTEYHKLLIN